jgi:hypothetical protein
MDPILLADVIDDHVAEHENDGGGRSECERRAIVMDMLHHFAECLREYDNRASGALEETP